MFEDEAGYEPLGDARLVERSDHGVRLRAGQTTVEVAAIAPGVLRVGMFGGGRPPAYVTEAVPPRAPSAAPVEIAEEGDAVVLRTPEASARIALAPLRVSFADFDGRALASDDPALGMGFAPRERELFDARLGDAPRVYKRREPGERFFGCGERTSGLEKTGSYQLFWNIDPPSGHTASFNNLYTSIPFLLALRDGRAHGVFLDTGHRAEFDLAKSDGDRVALAADGGDLVYYVLCGPAPRQVVERYTDLTGRTPMPPLWALGNQQSRWSYETADEVRAVARGFREHDIPLDGLYLDIDYMDGYRVFTWDGERFPEPRELIAELREQGVRIVTIVDPGVRVDEGYSVYREGAASDLYCLTADGAEYHNVVWPGVCAFPDFTNPRTRAWWGRLHAVLLDAGVAGIWNDMNEPALMVPKQSTMPPDVVHPGGGDPRLHAEVHNLYGSLMSRATREGLLALRPDQRPFVISRAGFAGLQRHAMHWTGDNSSWWEHLWMSMPQLQNLGLSGLAWAGVDIGGFFGDSDGELLARFTEFGAFQPFCRNHSAKGTARQEPWAFGEPYTTVCRDMLKLRMRLLPYLYALFEECHRTGAPILRPLLFEHPDDPVTYATDDQVLLGADLLLAPVTRPGVEHRHVYLPAGTWVHWWTGERIDGPAHVLAHAPLGRPALYARANTPLPLWPALAHTGETPDLLTLRVFCAPGAAGGAAALYEDEGDGFGYRDGAFARRDASCEATGALTLRLGAREGAWVPRRERIELELRGVAPPPAVHVDGAAHDDWRHDGEALFVGLPEGPEPRRVEIPAVG
jgi:alpha-glucosidase